MRCIPTTPEDLYIYFSGCVATVCNNIIWMCVSKCLRVNIWTSSISGWLYASGHQRRVVPGFFKIILCSVTAPEILCKVGNWFKHACLYHVLLTNTEAPSYTKLHINYSSNTFRCTPIQPAGNSVQWQVPWNTS